MKVLIAFYKGKGDFSDTLIKWWTKSKYSHTEIILNERWFSSSPRTPSGVRSKLIKKEKGKWDYIEIDLELNQINSILNNFKLEEGKKYDWAGIFLSQFFPFRIQNKNKWFCSEIVSYLLQKAEVIDDNRLPSSYNPGNLFDKLVFYGKLIKG
jgi:hypothetical protein